MVGGKSIIHRPFLEQTSIGLPLWEQRVKCQQFLELAPKTVELYQITPTVASIHLRQVVYKRNVLCPTVMIFVETFFLETEKCHHWLKV